MLTAKDVSLMSTPEKLEAIDLIMNSFGKNGSEMPSPAWHQDVLSERMRLIESGEAKWLSIEEFENEINQLGS